MATVPASRTRTVHYPTSDGKPMAETDTHRDDMLDLIGMLRGWYRGQKVYVTGNILVYYEEGNPRKVISPDVWVARGVEQRQRDNYLIWREAKGPEAAIELTSKSTRREDTDKKFVLYEDVLKVQEYFLFDPCGHYLDPPLKGYRLVRGKYVAIKPVDGRLPSKVLDLHLEADGTRLRLWDPASKTYLLPPEEQAEQERTGREAERAGRLQAEAEVERLRRELEDFRRRQQEGS